MHNKFQEIISKFLKSTTLKLEGEYNPILENHVDQVVSIQQTLISYENHIKLYHSLINYLDSESLLLTKNLDSGQITNRKELNKISIKISELSTHSDLLLSLINNLNHEFSSLVTNREFLNLQTPKFSDFEHFTNSTEFNVFFLNDDYTSGFANTPRYKRLNLNKKDFNKLELIYQAALNPADFLHKIHKSLNLDDDKKIALCNYEPRHHGFLVYFDPTLVETTTLFENLSKTSPNYLYRLNGGDSWIINTLEYNFDSNELLNCFDVWVDTNWLTIYLQTSLFPITEISNPLSNSKMVHSCHHGSFLDEITEGILISKLQLVATLSRSNPYWYLQDVLIFNGTEFIEINDESTLIIHQDPALIKFYNGENEAFIGYYSPINNELILYTDIGGTEAELLNKTYILGLAIAQNQSVVVD